MNFKRNSQSGFAALLSLVFACLIIAILSALAIPSLVRMQQATAQQAARIRVSDIGAAKNALTVCTALPSSCGVGAVTALTGMIPVNGSIGAQHYTFVMSNAGTANWTFTATMIPGYAPSPGLKNFYVDQTGVVRCAYLTTPTVASGVCP